MNLFEIALEAGVTRVGDITGLDYLGIPVFIAVRPNSRSLSVASGKGYDPDAARWSCTMEAVELEFAETPTLETAYETSREATLRWSVPDLESLPKDCRHAFVAERPIDWVEGLDLPSGSPYAVPFDLVHLDLTVEKMQSSGGFLVSTNGLCAGLSAKQAQLHGTLEVIERDALALVTNPSGDLAFAPNSAIQLDAISNGECEDLVSRCQSCGMSLQVWDITSDIGIPVIYCRLSETDAAPHRLAPPADGVGCHPDAGIALRRAITEAAQSRLTLISGSRDDITKSHYVRPLADNASRPYLRSMPHAPYNLPKEDSALLDWTIAHLKRVGFENVIAVDIAAGHARVSVYRIIVPGLEGMTLSRGYVPGKRAHRAWQERLL